MIENKTIRKILLEKTITQDVRGYDDQRDILEKGRLYCPTFKALVGDRIVKRLDNADIVKFKDLSGQESVAYISVPVGNNLKMFFGVVDPNSQNKNKSSYLTYFIQDGKTPQKYTEGWGLDCEQMQQTKELGKDTLSTEEKNSLESFLRDNKGIYTTFVDNANQGEFIKVDYADLVYKSTGRPVLPNYIGNGYLFQRRNLENVNQSKTDQMDVVLSAQGFTRVEPENASSPEANAGFYIKDIAMDLPSLSSLSKESPNTKVWPKPGTLVAPSRGDCRDKIKLLTKCSKLTSPFPPECLTDLFKNKILVLQCQTKGFASGGLGVGDEYEALMSDQKSKFGLKKLSNAMEIGFERSSVNTGPDLTIKEDTLYPENFEVLKEEMDRIKEIIKII